MQLRPRALVLAAVCSFAACSRSSPDDLVRFEPASRARSVPAPADVGRDCADVAEERACWTSATDVVRVERPLRGAKAERGYRCSGSGAQRVCEDRAFASDAWQCANDRCTQRHPRLPDTGEWECADLEGVVICRGWSAAAGVVTGPDDPGWFCGARRDAPGERICVDFAPDRPPGEPWACRFQYESNAPPRLCVKGGRPPLGRACENGCPLGSACASGRCLPLKPAPGCWIDRDCGAGHKCAFGTCLRVNP